MKNLLSFIKKSSMAARFLCLASHYLGKMKWLHTYLNKLLFSLIKAGHHSSVSFLFCRDLAPYLVLNVLHSRIML
jgi:hypothetical protein